jgi:hypothetical protein
MNLIGENMVKSFWDENVADSGALEAKTKKVDIFVEESGDNLNELVCIHRAIIVTRPRQIPALQFDRSAQIGANIVVKSFHAQAIADDRTAFVANPIELVEPGTERPHPGLSGVFGYGQYSLLPDEVFKRRVGNEQSSRIVCGPVRCILSREMVSRRGPAPRISDDCEKLEISSDPVRDVHVAVVKRLAQGYIPLKIQGIPDGLTRILRNVDEVKTRVTVVVPIPTYCASHKRSQWHEYIRLSRSGGKEQQDQGNRRDSGGKRQIN